MSFSRPDLPELIQEIEMLIAEIECTLADDVLAEARRRLDAANIMVS